MIPVVDGPINPDVEGLPGEPADSATVLRQLQRIVASPEFLRCDRLSAFLVFVVQASLAGERQKLSERRIGEGVFGKERGWDPRGDTIVRSEARRLRRKLKEFYAGSGLDSPVLIDLPLGSYVATFRPTGRSVPNEIPALPLVSSPNPPLAPLPVVRARWPWWSALAIALAAVSFLLIRQPKPQIPANFKIAPFAVEIGEEYSPAVAPDDAHIAYVWDGNLGKPDIYLQNADGTQRQRVTHGEGEYYLPAWSPDGRRLSYLRLLNHKLEVLIRTLADGSETVVTQIHGEMGRWSSDSGPLLGNFGPEWSRDGTALYVADRQFSDGGVGGIYRVSLRDGSRSEITSAPGELRDFAPRIAPDGRTLAFVRYFSHGHGELFVTSVHGGPIRQLTNDGRDIQGITWSADGRSLIFSSNRSSYFQLWSIPAEGGAPILLPTNTTSAMSPVAFHHSARIVFDDASENWNIWRYPVLPTGLGEGQPFLTSSGRNHDPRYAPNGKRIAFISDRSGTLEVWSVAPDGTDGQQLTHLNGSWVNSLSWSPDGKKIAFDARPKGNSAIYAVPATGGPLELIDDAGVEQRMPGWAADGRSIYFNSVKDGAVAIYLKTLETGTTSRVSEHEMYTVASSFDGRQLFYSDRSGNIWQANPDGSSPHALGLKAFPVKSWAVTAHGIVYSEATETPGKFRILLWEGGTPRLLGVPARSLVTNDPDLSLSPDGRWLLVAQQDQMRSDIKLRIP